MKRLVLDAAKCSGCNSCALTCSLVHEHLFSPERSRIRIERDAEHAVCTPMVCIQCNDAPCIDACPVQALSRSPTTAAIIVREEGCTGCERCVEACPHGGIGFDRDRGLPMICDLCDGNPECVGFCQFTMALQYVAPEEISE